MRRFIRDAVTGLAVRKAVDLGAGSSPYRNVMAQALPGAWLIATDLQFRDTDLVADATQLPFADSRMHVFGIPEGFYRSTSVYPRY